MNRTIGGASLPRLFPSHISENMFRSSFRPASEISRFDSEEFFFVVPILILNPADFNSLAVLAISCLSEESNAGQTRLHHPSYMERNQFCFLPAFLQASVLLPPCISSSIFCVMKSLVLSSAFVRSSHADNR